MANDGASQDDCEDRGLQMKIRIGVLMQMKRYMPTWKCVAAFEYFSDATATKVKKARSLPEKQLERGAYR